MATSSDYWAKRAAELEERAAGQGGAVTRRALRHYRRAAREIREKVEAFYGRYAVEQSVSYEEAVKILRGTDAKVWAKTLGEYVDEINALPDGTLKNQLRAELDARAYSSRITRLDALRAQVDMEVDRLMMKLESEMQEGFGDLYTDSYYRKMFDIQRHAGRMFDFAHLNRELVESALTYPWSGADFSSRLWENKRALLFHLREIMAQGIIQGKGVSVLSKELSDKMGQSFKVAERLIRTEANHFHNAADVAAYEAAGVRQYEFMATLDNRTSAVCAGLDGKIFNIKDAQAGVNYPPMHPHCVLPDTKIIAPDMEAIIKGEYSGNVVEIGTSNGTRLTVTANHIVLTARGWVRAKNLVEGDKIVRYCGRTKPMVEANPANNDGVPTIEELFTSIIETSAVAPLSVPVSAEDLKGDAISDSEVDIIFVDSKLRDKVNPSLLEFIGDIPLVGTAEIDKGHLPCNCTLAEFLVGAGLTADGIVSGLDIAEVLLRRSQTHHELVGLRVPSDYNTRLIETAKDNRGADTKHFGKLHLAHTGGIKRDNFVDIDGNPLSSCADTEMFEHVVDGASVNPVEISNFFAAFPGIVAFEDIVFISSKFYSGHVYDASAQSTLYIANGIFTSNCRSTTVEYDPDEWRDWEAIGQPMPKRMTYAEWTEQQGIEAPGVLNGADESGKIKAKNRIRKPNIQFSPAKTVEEADEYLRSLGISASYAKDRTNLDVANMVNKTVAEFQNVFGADSLKLGSIRKWPKRDANFAAAYNGAFGDVFLYKVQSKDTMSKLLKEAAEEFKYGAWSTDKVEHVIRHELGHALHMGIGKKTRRTELEAIFKTATDPLRWGKYGFTLDAYKAAGLTGADFVADAKAAGDVLSAYGFTSVDEMVAESVAEYMSENPRQFAIEVVDTLMGW